MISISKKQLIYLIGIGAFVFMTIAGFAHLSKNVFRVIQIWFGQDPVANFWISNILSILVFNTLGFGFMYALIKKNDLSLRRLRRLFFIWIVLLFVSLTLHAIHSYFVSGFVVGERIDEFDIYHKLVSDEDSFGIWKVIFGLFEYVNFILLVFIGQKTVANNV